MPSSIRGAEQNGVKKINLLRMRGRSHVRFISIATQFTLSVREKRWASQLQNAENVKGISRVPDVLDLTPLRRLLNDASRTVCNTREKA